MNKGINSWYWQSRNRMLSAGRKNHTTLPDEMGQSELINAVNLALKLVSLALVEAPHRNWCQVSLFLGSPVLPTF